MKLKHLLRILAALLSATPAHAAPAARLAELARTQIQQAYPGAQVSVAAEGLSCVGGQLPAGAQSASLLNDTGRGYARLMVQGKAQTECWAQFQARMPAWIAKHRVLPGERLTNEGFELKDVDVSQGMAREMRGLLLDRQAPLASLEARQTLLEGQMVLSSAVQRVPDLKRGDTVQIRMQVGGVILSTQGTAEEPAYLQAPVRVLSQKSKRLLVGKLVETGVVEVRL